MENISSATFDILEKMAHMHPAIKGAYSRSTGGVDIDLIIAVLGSEICGEDNQPTPSEAFSAWLNVGPDLALAAGCHVGIKVTEAQK